MPDIDVDATRRRLLQAIGEALTDCMDRAGVSRGELARRTGIDKSTISRYASGDLMPSIERLDRIAGALGIAASALLGHSAATGVAMAYQVAQGGWLREPWSGAMPAVMVIEADGGGLAEGDLVYVEPGDPREHRWCVAREPDGQHRMCRVRVVGDAVGLQGLGDDDTILLDERREILAVSVRRSVVA